ncbi:3-oxoacyl-ACP reductase [Calidifontibacter terrae]
MTDGFTKFVNQGFGKTVAKNLGLPQPAILRRFKAGQDLLEGSAAVGSVAGSQLGSVVSDLITESGAKVIEAQADSSYGEKLSAVVFDASAATTIDQLQELRATIGPAMKALGKNGRIVIIGAVPSEKKNVEAAATQQALEGIARSLGKEMRAGGTANLLRVAEGASPEAVRGPLRFFLSSRSAYVSGQPVTIVDTETVSVADLDRPLAGEVAVITGAARGIGAEIAKVFARAGAKVIAVDIPAAGESLTKVANQIGATALQLDITSPDAGERIAKAVAQHSDKLDIIVHNAGITRDKLFVNTDESRWGSVLDVNLQSQFRMNAVLLDPAVKGGLKDGGRIVSVASISGIGGNRGQSNYAASKAGVIGMVRELSQELADRRITVNAVAPGFIETEMTAKIPVATREVGRRLNSLLQGGQPVDVGEAIAFFAEPTSGGVTGQVLRVCGQSQLGA